jgi:Tfp pilus assembly protein PilZ
MQILKVRFRTNQEFEDAYQPDLANGGLFCPTTTPFDADSEVVVEINAPALPNKVLIRGVVRSWRPALPRLRVRAGAIVEFEADESEKRAFVVETIAGERPPSSRRKHTRLPVAVEVRYRTMDSADLTDGQLSEISVGGALLHTTTPLPIDTDVILEITPPGAVRPISVSGKATYHLDNGGTGLKFIYRDGGGTRRLRELIRRLKQS